MKPVYLDYNATTPLDPSVREAMMPYLGEIFGNPSSIHVLGQNARAHLHRAHERAASVLGCSPMEVVFTSGGTESNNFAILGTARSLRARGRHLITSSIEHHAVLDCFNYLEKHEGFAVTRLPVGMDGRIAIKDLEAAFRPDTVLASIMAANNEIGTLQPVAEIGAACRARGVVFHTDAAQWVGKEPFNGVESFNADLLSVCAHKFHGPKGAGLLYVRSNLTPHPILLGGSQQEYLRAGTENLAAIAGLTEALERFVPKPVFDQSQIAPLARRVIEMVKSLPGCKLVSPENGRLVNTISFVVKDAESVVLIAGLDLAGVCASSGAACSSGVLEPSHVVAALGFSPELANALVRLSLGRETTEADIAHLEQVLPEVVQRAQLPAQYGKNS